MGIVNAVTAGVVCNMLEIGLELDEKVDLATKKWSEAKSSPALRRKIARKLLDLYVVFADSFNNFTLWIIDRIIKWSNRQ